MKLDRVFSVICLFFLALSLPLSAQSTETGQIGTPKPLDPNIIGAGGEFTHRIQVAMPEFRDLPLPISLNYNSSDTSRSGVGKVVAFGWTLGGMSMIERKSLGGGVPTFDDGQDLYLLDGQELMACKGAGATNPWTPYYPLRYLTDQASGSCLSGGNLTARVDDHRRILFDAATNSFTVTRPDGIRMIYKSIGELAGDVGATVNYGPKARWLLTRIEDTQATRNVVTYSYLFAPKEDGYAHRIDRIDYAGYSVRFGYGTFPANSVAKFATGTSLMGKQAYQLRSIRVMEGEVPIRGYKLTFTTSALTQTQLLQKVEEYGADLTYAAPEITAGAKLPAQEFGYSVDAVSFELKTYPGKEFHEAVTVYDTNFDGTDELIFSPEKLRSITRTTNTVSYPVYYTFMAGNYGFDRSRSIVSNPLLIQTCRRTVVNPDLGDADYVRRVREPIDIVANERDGTPLACIRFTPSHTKTSANEYWTTKFKVDTVPLSSTTGAATATINWTVAGKLYDPQKLSGNFDTDGNAEYLSAGKLYNVSSSSIVSGSSLSAGLDPTIQPGNYVTDLTGDGVDDVVGGNAAGFQNAFRRLVAENGYLSGALAGTGSHTSFALPSNTSSPFYYSNPLFFRAGPSPGEFVGFGDIDADGLSDFVAHEPNGASADVIRVFPSTGSSFSPPLVFTVPDMTLGKRLPDPIGSSAPQPTSVDHRTAIRDINSDGLTDIILHFGFTYLDSASANVNFKPYVSGKSWILLNTGNGFTPIPVSGSLDGFKRLVATGDFDGDGLTDIALEGEVNLTSGTLGLGGSYVPQDGRILFGNGGIPNRLTSIKSTTGATTTIAYAPSSDFGTNQMPGVQQVVKSITTDDGRGGVSKVDYRYVGGRYDFIARQTLGYKTVTAYLPALPGETEGPQIVTTYLNDHVVEYGLVKSRVVTQGGVTLSRDIFDYTIQKTGNGPWQADRTSERSAILFGTALVETAKTRAYDAFGQIIRETDLGFTTDGANLDASDDVTVTMGYSPNLAAYIVDRPTFRRTEAGPTPTATLTDDLAYAALTYDNAATSATAPTVGNLTKVEEWTGTLASLTLRTAKALTYDAWGNVLTETDAKGNTTTYTYETAKRLFRLTTSNALGQVEAVAWNTLCQAPATVTDPNLRATAKTYDSFCRETRTDLPGGQYLITRYVSFGTPTLQHVERETKSGSATAGRDRSITREYLDGLGRTWAKTQAGTTSAIADAIVQLSAYDTRGNLAWTSLPLPFSSLNTTPNAAQRTSFTYDGLARPVDTLMPDGAKRSLSYPTVSLSHYGGTTLAYPATRSQDEHCFDAAAANTICGEATQITDAAGRLIRSDRNDTALTDLDAGGAALRSTSYRYDRKGSLIGVTDPGGITFAYTYDTFGNRLTADDPGLGFWTLTYDANNNLLTQTDAKGQLISFAYDALNRVTLKTVGTGPSRVETRFTYDQARAGFFNIGKETTQEVWTPSGTTHKVERDWHLMGGLAVERHTIDARTYALETSFAPNGAPLDQKLPGTPGSTATNWIGALVYDPGGRVTGLTGYITSIAYNAWNQPTSATYANGVTETYAYNPSRGWLTSVTGTLPGGDMAFRAGYDRSATGRISRADTQAMVGGTPTDLGGSYDYAYDYTGRLLAATNWRGVTAFSQAFAYDRAGRIRAKGPTLATATTYAYTDPLKPDHAPTSVTTAGVTTPFTYDANGNMLTGLAGKIMTYDGENRPLSVTHLGKRTCYVYGADGKRLKKVEGLPPTQDCAALPANANTTVYFGAVEVRNWLVAGAEQVLTYPHPAVKLLNGTTPAAATYLHRDGLSSVRAITNAAGAKIEAALYKPFGEQSEWVMPGNAAPETKGWIGERFDADAGLQYLNARYYDPELSLFLQPDWFEVTKKGVGTNRFSYSFNDPVNARDPNGNCLEDFCIIEALFVAYVADAVWDAANSPEIGDSPLGNPIGVGTVALGEALEPHVGTLENFAQTTPFPQDDMVVGLAKGAVNLSESARGADRSSELVTSLDDVTSAGIVVRGSPQVTQGGDGLNHAMASIKQAVDGVNRAGVGKVISVDFNRPLSAILGVSSRLRPDVTITFATGAVDLIEVVSRSQTVRSQLEKIQKMVRSIEKSGKSASGDAKTIKETLEKKKN